MGTYQRRAEKSSTSGSWLKGIYNHNKVFVFVPKVCTCFTHVLQTVRVLLDCFVEKYSRRLILKREI